MTEILKAIIFGIVEGITEWLPISSTGHMILLNEFLTLDVSAQFWDMFLVVIQLGAILAVVVLFWNLIWPFARSSSEAVVAAEQNEKSGSLVKREYWVLRHGAHAGHYQLVQDRGVLPAGNRICCAGAG